MRFFTRLLTVTLIFFITVEAFLSSCSVAETSAEPFRFDLESDYTPVFKDKLVSGLNDLNKTPAGRQARTIFQADGIGDKPASCLDTAVDMIEAHEQLVRKDKY